jgi:tetratricopeptide (TPR) repeat protein
MRGLFSLAIQFASYSRVIPDSALFNRASARLRLDGSLAGCLRHVRQTRIGVKFSSFAIIAGATMAIFNIGQVLAQGTVIRHEGRVSLLPGMTMEDAQTAAETAARLDVWKEVAARLGNQAATQLFQVPADRLQALASGIIVVTYSDAKPTSPGQTRGVSVSASAQWDDTTLESKVRAQLADPEQLRRLQASLDRTLQALSVLMPAQGSASTTPSDWPSVARNIAAERAYAEGLELWDGQSFTPAKSAEQDFTASISASSKFAPAYIARGMARRSLGQHELALADFNMALQLDAKSAEAYHQRGILFRRELRIMQALQDFANAIRLDPSSASTLNSRGDVEAYLNDFRAALSDYDQAVKLEPNYAIAYYNRGTALAEQNQPQRAVEDYSRCLTLMPGLAIALNNRGNGYTRLQQYDKALNDLNEALRLDPRFAAAYNNRGEVYRIQKQYDRAIQDYNQALRLRPTYANAYANRGESYSSLEQFDLAFQDLEQAIKLNPTNSQAYADRGSAYAQLNLRNQACRDWKKSCDIGNSQVCKFLQSEKPC